MTTVVHDVALTDTLDCDFGQGQNLSAQDARIRAFKSSMSEYSPPGGSVICDVRVPFSSSNGGGYGSWGYDDEVVFTLNNRVMFASDPSMVSGFSDDVYGVIYDWDNCLN